MPMSVARVRRVFKRSSTPTRARSSASIFASSGLGGGGGTTAFAEGDVEFAAVVSIWSAFEVAAQDEGIHELAGGLFGDAEFVNELAQGNAARTEKERDEARQSANEVANQAQSLEKKLNEASSFLNTWRNGKSLVGAS
jgi:hypothetical protein